jgi:hypothetical protein
MKVDPITFAVIKSGLDSIADDMAYTVVRIARSEIVKDVMDFSAAICAADGQMVAQAKTIAQHLGAIPEAMESVLKKFEGDMTLITAACIFLIFLCSSRYFTKGSGVLLLLSFVIIPTLVAVFLDQMHRTQLRSIKKVSVFPR